MVIKRLRKNRNWSQDQLAQFSGLSLRTIQRVESGNSVSLESLKSLAAVFEVEVSTLENEVVVIDKSSGNWKKNPLWVRVWFMGSNRIEHKRKDLIKIEIFCIFLAVLVFVSGFAGPLSARAESLQIFAVLLVFGAYGISLTIRVGDKYSIW